MKSKLITLLFCTVATGISAYSQTATPSKNGEKMILNRFIDSTSKPVTYISSQMLVSPSFYTNNLAFFCRQEIKFEKITKVPFKFRLGSVQQVDYLEGKGQRKP